MNESDNKVISLESIKARREKIAQEELQEMEVLGLLNNAVEEPVGEGSIFIIPLQDGSLHISMTIPPDTDPVEFLRSNYEAP